MTEASATYSTGTDERATLDNTGNTGAHIEIRADLGRDQDLALRQACLAVVDRVERVHDIRPRTAWLRRAWRGGRLVKAET